MNVSRRRLLALGSTVGAARLVGAPRLARAKPPEWTYKYANNLPDTHPMNVRAREMAAAIKTETDGRLEVQIFPSNQLGSDTDTLSQIRSGGVEFFTLSGLILSTLVPAASINGIGFAFPDYASVWKAMDGELGAYVRGQIAKTNQILAMETIWDNGFRQTTTSTKPIKTPDDFRGMKLRVPVSPLWTSMFKALGAVARLDQLQRSLFGAADQDRRRPGKPARAHLHRQALRGAEILLADQPYVGRFLVPGQPPRLAGFAGGRARRSSAKNFNAAGVKERDDVAKLNATLQGDLTAKGLVFNKPDPAAVPRQASTRPASMRSGRPNTAMRPGPSSRSRRAS